MRSAAQKQHTTARRLPGDQVAHQLEFFLGIPSSRCPVREMVALIHDYHVPGTGVHHLLEMIFVNGPMNARENARIAPAGVRLASTPLTEGKPEPVELTAHVGDQSRRGEIKDAQARRVFE